MRARLRWLVAGLTASAILLVAVLTAQAYFNERAAISRHLLGTARAVSSLVDRQVGETEALLKGLALAAPLQRDDFAAFDGLARATVPSHSWIVLTDPDGHQLVNTRLPRGASLPSNRVDDFWPMIEGGRTYFSNLLHSANTGRACLRVTAPVFRDGRIIYALHYVMLPSAFAQSLAVQRFLPGAVVAILDRTGTVAARNRDNNQWVGRKATDDILAAISTSREGVQPSVTLEGIPVLAAYSRSPVCGWSVALGAPEADLLASAQRILWLGVALCGVLILVAVLLTRRLGRDIAHGVAGLVADTEAIGRGEMPARRAPQLHEIDFVAAAMQTTAQRLRERESETIHLTHLLQNELAKQKEAEQTSRRLAAIVTSSEDAIISETLDGVITSWNRGAERIFGYAEDEMVGRHLADLLPPDTAAEELADLTRIARGEHLPVRATVRPRKDGTLVDISLSVSPLRDASGRPIGACKIARDITRRRRAEERQGAIYELVAQANRAGSLDEIYTAALDTICTCQQVTRAAISLCDDRPVLRFAASRGLSDAFRAATAAHSPWPPETSAPQPVCYDDVATAPDLAPGVRHALQQEGIGALAFIPLVLEQRLLGQFTIYYDAPHAFSAAELQPAETVAAQVAFAIERHRSAEALEQLVDERTASLRQAVTQMQEFSYSVSHDLRAPVRAMRGYAEAVLEDYGEHLDAEGRRLLERIIRSGTRMDRLIQDLLTYSRLSRREVALEPVSLEKLVREVIQQYPDMHADRADIELPAPLPDVIGHEPSLTQAVSNLLSNAVKFVAPDTRPHVRVSFEKRSPLRGRLLFADNGIGIKPEHQSRLFGLFERIHPERAYEGTGVGLAIVRKAVERMNGSVGVESDGVAGSLFWIELPLAPDA